ncbi:MAG: NADH:flavin oxidoreductase [Acidobacteria bacterium]|nr:NADH:flavin oxidoreductase [Acidobacteriota bacterium]
MASFKTPDALAAHLTSSGIALPLDAQLLPPERSPFAQPIDVAGRRVANRLAVLPMEGWDGETDGRPSDLTRRRWRHFGESGAGMVWGGEAVAVRHDGRANPRQLMLTRDTAGAIGALAATLRDAHAARYGRDAADRLCVGLQLTHSGRFSRPDPGGEPAPLAAYRHPGLDRRTPHLRVLSDDELDRLCEDVVDRAYLARELGFDFVDIKHCHGYLGHELLTARTRDGRYGGPLAHRLRFLRNVAEGIRTVAPGLAIGVRLSAFDTAPFRAGADGIGAPDTTVETPDDFAFGRVRDDDPDAMLTDARDVLSALDALDIRLLCVTGGSPYYCPHVVRPALFPPSDGYLPPEDPLAGVARHVAVTWHLKRAFPQFVIVGSGYTYLQEWLPHVAQRALREGGVDVVGLGRMMLSYPDFPADVLAGRPLRRGALCRTFSDCTSGPRNGLVSGCYPLDPFYTAHADHGRLEQAKASSRLPGRRG